MNKNQFMKKKFYEKFLEVSFICENSSYRLLEGSYNFSWFQDSQICDFDFSAFPSSFHITHLGDFSY